MLEFGVAGDTGHHHLVQLQVAPEHVGAVVRFLCLTLAGCADGEGDAAECGIYGISFHAIIVLTSASSSCL